MSLAAKFSLPQQELRISQSLVVETSTSDPTSLLTEASVRQGRSTMAWAADEARFAFSQM
jgi:hypothetical protein